VEAEGQMSDQRPKRETMSLKEAAYDKIKDQVIAMQKWAGGGGDNEWPELFGVPESVVVYINGAPLLMYSCRMAPTSITS